MSYQDALDSVGFKGKLSFDVMVWFGDGNVHRQSAYVSADPSTIKKQIALIQEAGGAGVRITWLGPKYTYTHQAAMQWCMQCNATPGFLFCLLLDPHVSESPNWWLDPGFLTMMSAACYVPQKFLCDFSTGIDFSKVTFPAGTQVLANQKGMGWANAYNGQTAQTIAEIQATNKLASMTWPFLASDFRDAGRPTPTGVIPANYTGTRDFSQSVWPSKPAPTSIDCQAGNTFMNCVAALALCPNAPYVSMVWNDYDENPKPVEAFMAEFKNVRL